MRRGNGIVAALVLWFAACASSFSAEEKVRLASSPALSPDGTKLAFSWQGDIWIVDSAGGLARPLTLHEGRDFGPVFSPDGQAIAFTSDRQGAQHAYVVAVAGGSPRQLTFHSEGCRVEAWYLDGVALLINALPGSLETRGAFLPHRRGKPRQRATPVRRLRAQRLPLPDGKRLLFTREGVAWWRKGYRGSQASQIWLHQVGTKKFRNLRRRRADRSEIPLVAPSGNRFYYVSGQSGAFNSLATCDRRRPETQLTHFDDDSVVMPCIAGDGKRSFSAISSISTGSGPRPTRRQSGWTSPSGRTWSPTKRSGAGSTRRNKWPSATTAWRS